MTGVFYHFADHAAVEAAGLCDGEDGIVQPLTVIPGPVWLVDPVVSDPDPETGHRTLIADGEPSLPVVILSPFEIPALDDARITPPSMAGYA